MENKLDKTILEILKHWHKTEPGWWYGYDYLENEVYYLTRKQYTKEEIGQALKRLKAAGKVVTKPIFSESTGKLNGSGWFYLDD